MKHRMLRVNEVVKRELSGILAREISFEGALITISHVDVKSDLKSAHVFVSVLGAEKPDSVLAKLEKPRPAFQGELAGRGTMKFTPHLIFHLYESTARASRVRAIWQEIHAEREKQP